MVKRNAKTALISAAMLIVPSAASAQPAAAASAASAKDKVVCRSLMRTGTRFKKETCRTVAQWEQLTETSRRSASEVIDRPAISIERGN